MSYYPMLGFFILSNSFEWQNPREKILLLSHCLIKTHIFKLSCFIFRAFSETTRCAMREVLHNSYMCQLEDIEPAVKASIFNSYPQINYCDCKNFYHVRSLIFIGVLLCYKNWYVHTLLAQKVIPLSLITTYIQLKLVKLPKWWKLETVLW